MLLLHTTDHLHGIAGVLRAPETVMTHQTLTRAALASCAVAYDLLEPDLLVRERLRRGMNGYLLSYTEQINMTEDEQLDALAHSEQRIENIVKAARAHDIGVSKAPGGRFKVRRRPMDPPYLGTEPPRELELVRRLVSEDDADPLGALVYRMGSAFTQRPATRAQHAEPATPGESGAGNGTCADRCQSCRGRQGHRGDRLRRPQDGAAGFAALRVGPTAVAISGATRPEALGDGTGGAVAGARHLRTSLIRAGAGRATSPDSESPRHPRSGVR